MLAALQVPDVPLALLDVAEVCEPVVNVDLLPHAEDGLVPQLEEPLLADEVVLPVL